MWLLDPALRRSAYSIGRTSLAWTAHRRAPCEKAIRCNRYSCFGTPQRGDGISRRGTAAFSAPNGLTPLFRFVCDPRAGDKPQMSGFGGEAEILCSTRALPVLTYSGHEPD